ncbi:MAG: PDZ domain-containing protein [Cyclobacteriaceae bacterium]
MKIKLYILILAALFSGSFTRAGSLIKSEQEKIIEKIVTEIFVSGNKYDFLTVSRGNTQASYIEGYGLIIQTPTYHISSSAYFSSDGARASNQRAYAFSTNSLNIDSLSALRDEMVKELMQKFIVDYSNLAREVKENEKIYLFYNQQKTGAPGFIGLRSESNVAVWTGAENTEKGKKIISAEVEKDDLNQYKAGKIDKNTLVKRISMKEKISDASEKLEYKVLSTVFESALEEQFENDFMGPQSGVSYQVLGGFGVIYYIKVGTPFMFNFMPRLEMMIPEIRSDGNQLIIKNRRDNQETVIVYDKMLENIRGLDFEELDIEGAPRGFLGVQIANVEDLEMRKKIPDEKGVLVVVVNDNSPAENAGIEKGDVIVQIEKEKIENVEDLIRTIKKYSPGDKVKVSYYRNGKVKTVPVQLKMNEEQVEVMVEKAQRLVEENQKAIEEAQRAAEEVQREVEENQREVEEYQEEMEETQKELEVLGYGNRSEKQKEEMQEALTDLLQTLREYMVEYGSTLPNLDQDDVLMVEFSLEDCHFCDMPKTTTLMVKNEVLQKYDNRQISKEDAVAQVSVSSEK